MWEKWNGTQVQKEEKLKLLTTEVKILLFIYFLKHDLSMLLYLNFSDTLKHLLATFELSIFTMF